MYIASKLSLNDIRESVKQIKRGYKLKRGDRFPLQHFIGVLDRVYETEINDPFLLIESREEMGHELGRTLMDTSQIVLREDIYVRLDDDEDEGRLTAAHEIGHAVLHPHVALYRLEPNTYIPDFLCPEKQADSYACELLLDIDFVIKNHCRISAQGFAKIFGLPAYAVTDHLQRLVKNGDIEGLQLELDI